MDELTNNAKQKQPKFHILAICTNKIKQNINIENAKNQNQTKPKEN